MTSPEEIKKKTDEAWKETVEKEKGTDVKPSDGQDEYAQEINFGLYLSGLMIEGLIALGDIENPVTKKKETSLPHARYVIDLVAVLSEKTKNNLTNEEKLALEQILYELRMRYVAKANK